MEWRNGQLLDDEQIEQYHQFCERKQEPPPVIRYDRIIGWTLAGLFCGAFWALVWMFIR